ncbi:hypothetical protein J2Z19_006141 [Ensifer adhaerens]|uniref:Uncharacterized protein n=1 Tax=Ensifer adhaerens TaxID=106592 RepID=A0ACC5T5J4_ENSAD|nr:hypothetical protein [Ensifer adhaerens]
MEYMIHCEASLVNKKMHTCAMIYIIVFIAYLFALLRLSSNT